MKQYHIPFPTPGQHGRAPRINSRSMGLRHFVSAAYRSDGDDGSGGDDDESKKLLAQIQKQVEGIFQTRGFQDKKAVAEAITEQMKQFDGLDLAGLRTMADPDKGIMAIARKQGEAIAELEKRMQGEGGGENNLSVRAQVIKWQEANKEAFAAIKSGQRADLTPLEVRAPITMTTTTSLGSSAYLPNPQIMPGVNDLVRNQPIFRRYFAAGRKASSPTIIWVNKTNKQGNAQFIAEGTLKPLASFELSTETSAAKKVAEAMKVSTEMLQDIDYMESMIETELRYEVEMAVDAAVLTGSGTGANLKGVTTYATAYALTTVKTTTPNIADVALAAVTQLKTLNFNPNLIFLNTIDYANMMLTKDSQGRYVNAEGIKVALPPIVETNNLPQGKILVVDSSKYQVYPYIGYTVAWGWENDDFRKNLVTAIGEERLHAFMSANNAGAILYDNLSTIKTAITAA